MKAIAREEFVKRRERLLQHIGVGNIAIVFAAPEQSRNGDNHYPYRQDSNFYYLTGFLEPEAIAVFIPGRQQGEFLLFNRIRDPQKELWDGHRAGQEGACEQYGADQAFPIEQFDELLPELLLGCRQLHYSFGRSKDNDTRLIQAINGLRIKVRTGLEAPYQISNIEDFLGEMRLRKSPQEIALMRQAAEISAKAHCRVMQACRPGLYEYHLEAEFRHEFLQYGGASVAYEPIVGSGANACILHYRDNNAPLKEGDLLLADVGCEYQLYAADITRTFPINGKFNPEQRAIYELVLNAQLAGIQQVRPGVAWPQIQQAIVKVITQGLVELEILQGDVEELIEKKAYLAYYMHNSGHWLGLDVHDAGRYKLEGKWRILEPGMVLTVEPGIYITANNPKIAAKWWNIGVRIEDDVVVTETGCEVLTAGVPKTVADIETLMAKSS